MKIRVLIMMSLLGTLARADDTVHQALAVCHEYLVTSTYLSEEAEEYIQELMGSLTDAELSLEDAQLFFDLYQKFPQFRTSCQLISTVGGIGFRACPTGTGTVVMIADPTMDASTDYTFQLPNDAGSSGDILTTDGTGITSWQAGGFSGCEIISSCTYFIIEIPDAPDTYQLIIEPDITVEPPALQLAVDGDQPDISLELVVHGTGAFYVESDASEFVLSGGREYIVFPNVPGAARGAFAVDLQLTRTASDQVAGAFASVLIGGLANLIVGSAGFVIHPIGTDGGIASAIVGGLENTISGAATSGILCGSNNIIFGDSVLIEGTSNSAIIGGGDNYVSAVASAVIVGNNNSVNDQQAVIVGGESSTINPAGSNGAASAGIFGGTSNTIGSIVSSASSSVILGGDSNTAGNDESAIVGGASNNTYGFQSVVIGGNSNNINYGVSFSGGAEAAVIVGGAGNTIGNSSSSVNAENSGILGGVGNVIYNNGQESVIIGGNANTINDAFAAILGGASSNILSGGASSVILGGNNHTLSGPNSAVLAGQDNTVTGTYAVAGGLVSTASGIASFAMGNTALASGTCSVAMGNTAEAIHNGSFVFADNTGAGHTSPVANSFTVYATGGVYMPSSILSVGGTTAVMYNTTTGQLGYTISSQRYKDNIKPLDPAYGDKVLQLEPVSFNYKKTPDIDSIGLIAEAVQEILPELVVKNNDGEIETVKYHELPVLLLAALKKQAHAYDEKFQNLESQIVALQEQIRVLMYR